MLSAKHLLEARIVAIKWLPQFQDFFDVDINAIKLTDLDGLDLKKYHMIIDPEDVYLVNEEEDTISYDDDGNEIAMDSDDNLGIYNEYVNRSHDMLKTEVPNVLSYLHEINYQKFYKTTTSDEQMAMAFERGDLFSLIDEIINSLYEGMEYDYYLVSKYVLARRILDGTVTAIQISNFDSKTDREIVSEIKKVSNDMTFRSPKFNPAGIRKATKFDDQFAIVSTLFDARFTTNVLATSYFRSDAEMKAHMELCDGFGNFDMPRLAEVFAKRDANGDVIVGQYVDGYVPLTSDEMTALNEMPVVIVGRDFFQMYKYGLDNMAEGRKTEFFNPQTLRTNHWLHIWGAVSTSPFENAVAFTQTAQGVTSVSVSPSTASVTKGQKLQLTATVATTGFANKAVSWGINSVAETAGATINESGLLNVPSDYTSTGSGTAGVYTIAIPTILETGDTVTVNDVTYTVDKSSEDTIAKQITAMKSALNDAKVTDYFTIGGTSTTTTLTQKSSYYGQEVPEFSYVQGSTKTGECTITETTPGVVPNNTIIVVATSVYDQSKIGTSKITVS